MLLPELGSLGSLIGDRMLVDDTRQRSSELYEYLAESPFPQLRRDHRGTSDKPGPATIDLYIRLWRNQNAIAVFSLPSPRFQFSFSLVHRFFPMLPPPHTAAMALVCISEAQC